MGRFESPSVAIAGGNCGIGRATARALDHEGDEVAVLGRVGLSAEYFDEKGRRIVTRVQAGRFGCGEQAARAVLFPASNGGVARRGESVRIRP
jgi:NAD(P)-dependent dehydrogenase (short-subunit alcohol dehydrogenase family)